MVPLLSFIAMVITLYIWVVIISAILSWLIAFDVVNRRNRAVYLVADSFYRLTEPAMRPIRRVMPSSSESRAFLGPCSIRLTTNALSAPARHNTAATAALIADADPP